MKKKLFSLLLIVALSVFLISCKVKTAVLSFVTNQSSLTLSSVSVEIGTEIDLTKKEYQLTVDGYTFKGWYLDEALTSYARSVTLDKDVTIYAKWAKLYTITFDTNGGSAIESETVEAGNTLERPADPTKNDNVFNGWYTDSSLSQEFSFLTEIDRDITLYAGWLQALTVTFESNGGSRVESIPVLSGQKIELPDNPTKTGYEFGGWFRDSALTQAFSESQSITADITLYAKWDAHSYSVIFNGNGATSGTVNAEQFLYDEEKALSDNQYLKTGYIFTGWNTHSDGSGDSYEDKASVKNLVLEDGARLTLYAQWKPIEYTIVFNGGSATGAMDAISAKYDENKVLPISTLTYEGHELSGWALSENGDVIARDGETVKNLTTIDGATITLYAIFGETKYTVVFNKNSESATGEMVSLQLTYSQQDDLDECKFTNLGYNFLGWSTTQAGAVEIEDGAIISKLSNVDGATVTLYAVWELNKVTVTLNSGIAYGSDTILPEADYFTQVVLPENPYSLTGYHFLGWSTTQGGAVSFDDKATLSNLLESVTLYAVWQINTYTVEFNANSGSGEVASLNYQYNEEKALNTNSFTRVGYIFKEWNTNADGSGIKYADQASVKNLTENNDQTITLYAQWTPITYEVKFDANGGEGSLVNETFTYDEEKALSKNTFTKNYWKFVSWNTKADGTGFNYEDEKSVLNLSDTQGTIVTLYAKWTLNEYTISYDANGGSGDSMLTDRKDLNASTVYIPSCTYTKAGYTFKEWNTEADGTGTPYQANQSYNEHLTSTVGKNVKLYAQWTANSYTLKFDANKGNGSMSDMSFTYDIAQNLTLNAFTRKGYEFSGWNTIADGSGTSYSDQEEVKNLTTSGIITLYAKWNLIDYTITYNLNGGENDSNNPSSYTVISENIAFANPTRLGYTFEGWYSNDGLTGDQVSGIVSGSTGDVVLYASWQVITYSISYTLNGGENNVNNPKQYTVESDDISFLSATKTGYTFEGWYTDSLFAEDTKVEGIIKGSRTGNLSLYAKFTANTYTVHFNANGGTGSIADQVFTYDQNQSLTKNDSITRTGYTFLGWSEDSTATVAAFADQEEVSNLSSSANGEVTLFAVWHINTYNISYDLAGGSVVTALPATYNVESTVITIVNPTRTGYTFAGWTGTGLDEATMSVTIAQGSTGDREYTATWTANTYTVHFNANGGTGSIADQVFTYDQTQSLTKNESIERTGYTFAGWNTEADGSGNAYSDELDVKNLSQEVNGEVTLYAVWDTNSYLVTLNPNGADPNSMSKSSIGYNVEDDDITIITYLGSNPTKVGYTFGGWYKESDFSGEEVTVIETSEAANYILYAKWNLVTYTVTVVFNNGDSNSSFEYNIETPTFLVSSIVDNPTKTGYTFAGWTGTGLDEATMSVTIAQGSTGDRAYTATWTANTYTVHFNANGGTGSIANESFTYGVAKALTKSTLTRLGYTFLGWSEDSSATVATFADEEEVSNLTPTANGDVTLYAIWSLNIYNITYAGVDGADNSVNTTTTYTVLDEVVFAHPSKNGYTFTSWVDSESYPIDRITEGSTGDVTVTATWSLISYTLTYVVNGGEFLDVVTNPVTYNVESIDFGTQTNQFPVVTRAGYDFAGWYLEDDFSGSVVTVFDCSENYQNSTLYAKWTPHTYVINFSYESEGKPVAYDEAGNQIVQTDSKKYSYSQLSSDSITVEYETSDAFEPFSPYLYGYEFIGWGVKKAGAFDVVYLNGQILPWIPESLENGNVPVTLVAVYRPYTYEVKYDLGFIYNGNVDLTQEFTFGATNILLTLPQEVSKPGYTFDYWSYSGVKLGGAGYALPTDLLLGSEGAAVKLEAVWYKTGKFTVNYSTYDSNNYAEQAAQILYTVSETKLTGAKVTEELTDVHVALGSNKCYKKEGSTFTLFQSTDMNVIVPLVGAEKLYSIDLEEVNVITSQYDSNKHYGVSDSTKAIVTLTNTVGLYLITPGSPLTADGAGAAINAAGGVYYVREATGTTYTRRIYTSYDAVVADFNAYNLYTPTITKLAANAAYDGSTYYECVFDSNVEFRVSDSINKVITKDLYNNDGSHLDKNVFTSEGKYIEGWYTRLDFDTTLGQRYDANEATSSFDANSNITLYAKWADIHATFTYNLNDGTGDAPAQLTDVTSFTANDGEGIVREHYTLTGWNTEADGSGIEYAPGEVVENLNGYNPGDSVVLYAQWAPETYTVTFVKGSESATGSMETQEFSYNVGQTLSPNLFQYAGYNFVSWSGSDSKTYYEGINYVINANVTLTAQWAQQVNTITYNANFDTTQTMTQTSFTSQGTIKINLFTRTGYTFAGWNTEANGTGQSYNSGDTVSATTVLYAQWTVNNYYVAFNANGGTGSIANESFTYDQAKALSENTINRAGYRFTGWNTKADGTGTSYADKASVSNLTDINGAIVTLYAQWSVNTYKVRFNPNGGDGSPYFEYYQNFDVLTYGVEAILLKNTFTRPGFAFIGWALDQNATAADLMDGETIATQLVPKTDGEIIELYAVWSQSSYAITIKSSTDESTLETINVLKDSGIVAGTSLTLLEYINAHLGEIATFDSTNGIYRDKNNSNYAYVGIYTTNTYLDSDKLTNNYVARNNITFYAYFAVAAIFDLSEIDQENIVVPLGKGGSSYNAFAHFPEIDSPDGLIYVWDVTDDSLKSISATTIIKLYSIEFDGVHSTSEVTIDKTENTFQRLIVTLPNSHQITLMLTYTGSIGVNGVINSSSQIYTAMDTSSDFKYVDASSELVVSQSAHGQAFIQGISGFYQFHVYRTLSEFSLISGYGAYDALVLNGTRYINTVKTTYKVGTAGIWKLRFSISDNGLAQLSAHDVSKHYELHPQGSDTPYTTQIGSYTDPVTREEYVTYEFYKETSKNTLLAYIIVNYDELDKSYDAIQFTEAAEGMIFDIKVRPTFTLQKASNTISLNNVEVNNGVNVETSSELKRAYADISVENINIHSKIIAELEANQYHDFYDSSLPHTPINFVETVAVGVSQGTYDYSYNGIPVTTTGNVYVRAYTKSDFEHNVEAKNLRINGNYFTIDASRVPVVDLEDDGTTAFRGVEPNFTNANYDRTKFANKYIKNVQVSIFAQYTQYKPNKDYEYYGMNDVKVSYENMHIISNTITPYVDYGEDDETINNQVDTACYNSGGYIGIRTVQGTEETHNVIIDYSVIGLFASGYNTTINAYDTYVYYSWANALYTHGSGSVKLRNCEFRYSGGALSHVEELDNGKGTAEESSVFDSETKVLAQHDVAFDVDDRSRNVNWIAGNEIWMVLYGMNVLKSLMIVPMDQTVQDATGGTDGANGRYGILKTYDQLEKGKQGDTAYTINYQNSTELFNWAVLYMDKTPDGDGGKSGTYVGQLHSAFNGVTLDRSNTTTDATNAGLFPYRSLAQGGLGYQERSLGHLSTFPFYIAPVSSHSADYDHTSPNYQTNGLPYVIDSAWIAKEGETWDQNNAWAEGLTGDYAIKHHDGTPTPYGWAEIGVFAGGFNGIGYVIAYFPYGER